MPKIDAFTMQLWLRDCIIYKFRLFWFLREENKSQNVSKRKVKNSELKSKSEVTFILIQSFCGLC